MNDKTLTAEQKAHVLLLDIGSALIDKGFPLKKEMVRVFCPEASPVYSYANIFLTQCRKRNAWLKNEKIVSHKPASLIPTSKGKIR